MANIIIKHFSLISMGKMGDITVINNQFLIMQKYIYSFNVSHLWCWPPLHLDRFPSIPLWLDPEKYIKKTQCINPKVPNHEILGAEHSSNMWNEFYICKFFQALKVKVSHHWHLGASVKHTLVPIFKSLYHWNLVCTLWIFINCRW